jgi:predicted Zn-dependent peptidase
MAITAEDVERVAGKYVPLENMQLIAVGNAAKVRDVLSRYGPVEVFNSDGKRIAE